MKTWDQQKSNIESLIGNYNENLDQFDEESQRLSDMNKFWQQYLEDNKSREHNASLIDKVQSISQKVNELNPLYESRFSDLFQGLNQLNRLNSQVVLCSTKLYYSRIDIKQKDNSAILEVSG